MAASSPLDTLAQWLFKGSFGHMASYPVTSGRLSREELDALRRFIDESPRGDEEAEGHDRHP